MNEQLEQILVIQAKISNLHSQQGKIYEDEKKLEKELGLVIAPIIKDKKYLSTFVWTIDPSSAYFYLESTGLIQDSEFYKLWKIINFDPVYIAEGVKLTYNFEGGRIRIMFDDYSESLSSKKEPHTYKIGFDFLREWSDLRLDWKIVKKEQVYLQNKLTKLSELSNKLLGLASH